MGLEQDLGRRLELVLTAVERSRSLFDLLSITGLALEEHLG
jgi:hypothetical protein